MSEDNKAKCQELANEMVKRGMIVDTQEGIDAQVVELLTLNEASFKSMEHFVAQQAVIGYLTAPKGRMPVVGRVNDDTARGMGALPPPGREWEIGMTVEAIDFVREAEQAIFDLRKAIESIKGGVTCLPGNTPIQFLTDLKKQ